MTKPLIERGEEFDALPHLYHQVMNIIDGHQTRELVYLSRHCITRQTHTGKDEDIARYTITLDIKVTNHMTGRVLSPIRLSWSVMKPKHGEYHCTAGTYNGVTVSTLMALCKCLVCEADTNKDSALIALALSQYL